MADAVRRFFRVEALAPRVGDRLRIK
jgi:hypothetical protein